jgi:hypothetical protein
MSFHNRLSLLLLSTAGYVVHGFGIRRLKIEVMHPLRVRMLQTPNVVWPAIRNRRRSIGIRTAIPILFAIPLETSGARRGLVETRNAFETFDSVSRLGAASTITPSGKTPDRMPSARLCVIKEPSASFDAGARIGPIDRHGIPIFCDPRFIDAL